MQLTNEVLAEYVALCEDIKPKVKRIEEIKAACKQKGPFSTRDYVCTVNKYNRLTLPPLNDVLLVISYDTLKMLNLLQTITVAAVHINKKQRLEESLSEEAQV